MAVSSLVPASAGATVTDGNNAGWNKGPYDITWTQIGFIEPTGLTTATFSSTGGYKYLRLLGLGFSNQTSATNLRIRFNGDTASNYQTQYTSISGINGTQGAGGSGSTGIIVGAYDSGVYNNYFDMKMINPTQSNGKKMIDFDFTGNDGSAFRNNRGIGIYNSDTVITSISLSSVNNYVWSSNGGSSGLYLFGAN